MAADRDQKAMQFVKPNPLHRPGPAVGEDHGFADQFGLGFLQRNRPIRSMIEAAGFRIDHIETGYIPGPKPMTFMYEGSARPD